MYVVHKQVLELILEQRIAVPEGTEFLHVGEQNNQLCIWYRCEPTRPKIYRKLLVRGTGHICPAGPYYGTALLDGGASVFHVFEG